MGRRSQPTRRRLLAQHASHRSGLLPGIPALVALLAALALAMLLGASQATAEGGERPYDDGSALHSLDPVGDLPIALAIEFFTDLPPAVWPSEAIPVAICTQQHNRPSAVTAEQFGDAVSSVTSMWTAQAVGVGFDYTGDCADGNRWRMDNGVTEIGFDDFRDVVKGQSAAIATGTWTSIFGPKEFVEFDIVLDQRLNILPQCFESIIAHELGHVLGLGHSDDAGDLMYPSFDPGDPGTCPTEAREVEVDALRGLYGINLPPEVEEPPTVLAAPGEAIDATVVAEDPEGDALTFSWEQLDGEPVEFESDGATLSFNAPDDPGGELRFRVTVADPIGHTTVVDVLIGIDATPTPPTLAPMLADIGIAADGRDAAFEWMLPSGANSFELCSDGAVEVCRRTSSGSQVISWESVITTAGSATARRIFTNGARETSATACNAAGCGPASTGPLAGGIRWVPWDIDFDYFGMAMDMSGISITIAGAVNLSDEPRAFTLYAGSEANPRERVLRRCGTLESGESCLGVLAPGAQGHGTVVTIVSFANGTPTTEHRITIR